MGSCVTFQSTCQSYVDEKEKLKHPKKRNSLRQGDKVGNSMLIVHFESLLHSNSLKATGEIDEFPESNVRTASWHLGK